MEGSVPLQEKLLADPEILRAFFGEEEETPGKLGVIEEGALADILQRATAIRNHGVTELQSGIGAKHLGTNGRPLCLEPAYAYVLIARLG